MRLAALDASTAANSSRYQGLPVIGCASAPKTLSEISSLARPRPESPTPAYMITAIETSR